MPDPRRLSDAGRTCVSIWATDASGQRQPLALLRLRALQALDRQGGLRLDLPRAVAVIGFEVYDRNGPSTGLTGEIRRQSASSSLLPRRSSSSDRRSNNRSARCG